MPITTSGLVFAIQSLDFSKPAKTRFQYGSSVCLLSIAAPMAGTCDDASPAIIFATGLLPFLCCGFRRFGFGLRFGFRHRGFGCGLLCGLVVLARLRPIAFHRASAA